MLLLGAIAILIAAPAMAFHDGGVANCQGCHTMHNSQGGAAMNKSADGTAAGLAVGQGYTDLLLFPNASDVCLSCHGRSTGGGYNVWEDVPSIDGDYYSAGNFVFLKEDNINDGHGGATNAILGEQSGHTLASGIKATNWDSVLTAPPSDGTGTLTNNEIYCSSCHDPHGNSSFRLLYRQGQTVDVGGDTVTYGATLEAASIGYSAVETNSNHNAYYSGYSEWCSSCHTGFHAGSGNLIHPSGEALSATVIAKYTAYNGTTDCVANPGPPCGTGVAATAYLAAVPFEDPDSTTYTTTSTVGPSAASKVACVSCHRAHATSAKDAGRWDFQVSLLHEDGDESGAIALPNPYDDNQRSLCNKCHSQDEFDEVAVIP
jgi:hypothetical protein